MKTNLKLENQKKQVRKWSKIISLVIAFLPMVISFLKGKSPSLPKDKGNWIVFLMMLLVLGLISYLVNYYVISSIFWPESLGVGGWVLFGICLPGSLMGMREIMKLGGKTW